MPRYLKKERIAEFKALYDSGLPIKQIAEQMGICTGSCYNYARYNGYKLGKSFVSECPKDITPVPIEDLTFKSCRWPFTVAGKHAGYCGENKVSREYCENHLKMSALLTERAA